MLFDRISTRLVNMSLLFRSVFTIRAIRVILLPMKKCFNFFTKLSRDNDLNLTAHHAIACFLTAAHTTVLEWLKRAQSDKKFNGFQLHAYWQKFFSAVVGLANSASRYSFAVCFHTHSLLIDETAAGNYP